MKVVLALVLCISVSIALSRPLNLRDGANVDDKFVEKITLLEQDALTFVENRLVAQLKISKEEAQTYKLNFLQWVSLNFLVNSTSSPATTGPFVPNLNVDEFWHNFILYTKKYHAWCYKHFGHFIHHVPEEESTEEAVTQHDTQWLKTVVLMKDLYGVNWVTSQFEDGTCGNCHALDNDASCGGCTTAGCSGSTTKGAITDNTKSGGCGSSGSCGSCGSSTK